MPLVRWSVTNRGGKKVEATVAMHDLIGGPVEYPGAPQHSAPNEVDDLRQVANGGYTESKSRAPAKAQWQGAAVQLQLCRVEADSSKGPLVKVLPWPLPQGSMEPDYVYELRVQLDDGGDPNLPLVTLWALDALGYWWLLCERFPVNLT